MLGLAILVGFTFLGELLHYLLEMPIPGNVIGLILFVIALFSGIIKLEQVEQAASFLLKYLAFFFIPIVVSTMTVFDLVAENIVIIAVSLPVSTIAVLLVTGWIVKYTTNNEQDSKEEGGA